MNFDFSDEQKALAGQARRLLGEQFGRGAARAVLDEPARGYDAALWAKAAEMGWLGAAIPEAYGGLGLGRLELCVLAEEVGRALAPIPFSSTLYFFAEAVLLAGSEAQKQAVLPGVASGAVIGCWGTAEGPGPADPTRLATKFEGGKLSGVKLPVTDGGIATHAIILAKEGDGASLALVDLAQAGVVREPLHTLDPSRGHATITFDAVPAERLGAAGAGPALMEAVLDRAAALMAFEQLGGAQACLDMAVAYAKERQAFGRPIGSFQAIKHKLADIYVATELARSHAFYAAWALSTDAAELPLAAAAARVAACEAYTLAAEENVQTHGGMGFTWDVDCHLFYRRAKLLSVQAGAPGVWREKLVRRLERRNAA